MTVEQLRQQVRGEVVEPAREALPAAPGHSRQSPDSGNGGFLSLPRPSGSSPW